MCMIYYVQRIHMCMIYYVQRIHMCIIYCNSYTCVTQTAAKTTGVLHIKDPPSKMQMGPQRTVAGGRTCESECGGSTGKAIHDIPSSSLTQVLQFFVTSSCPRHPHPQLLPFSYFSISHYWKINRLNFSLFLVDLSLLLSIWVFSFRPDGQFSS